LLKGFDPHAVFSRDPNREASKGGKVIFLQDKGKIYFVDHRQHDLVLNLIHNRPVIIIPRP